MHIIVLCSRLEEKQLCDWLSCIKNSSIVQLRLSMYIHLGKCLFIRGGLFVTQSTRTICAYGSTCAAFFLSTHSCMCMKEHLVHAWLHKMYPQVLFGQEVLRVLAELNMAEIVYRVCAHHYMPFSLKLKPSCTIYTQKTLDQLIITDYITWI